MLGQGVGALGGSAGRRIAASFDKFERYVGSMRRLWTHRASTPRRRWCGSCCATWSGGRTGAHRCAAPPSTARRSRWGCDRRGHHRSRGRPGLHDHRVRGQHRLGVEGCRAPRYRTRWSRSVPTGAGRGSEVPLAVAPYLAIYCWRCAASTNWRPSTRRLLSGVKPPGRTPWRTRPPERRRRASTWHGGCPRAWAARRPRRPLVDVDFVDTVEGPALVVHPAVEQLASPTGEQASSG